MKMASKDQVTQKLKIEMERQGWSGRALSEEAGLPYYAVSRFLTGKNSKIQTLEAIAKALNKPIFYFMGNNHSSPIPNNNISPKANNLQSKKMADIPYDGEFYRQLISIIENIFIDKNITLDPFLMNMAIKIAYPKLYNSHKDTKEIKSYLEGLIDYSLNN